MNGVELVRATRRPDTHEEFDRRVATQAEALRDAFADGAFDGAFTLGLELERIDVAGASIQFSTGNDGDDD